MDDATRRKRSCAAGYLLSLAGKPLPLNTKREPVAYLYNGVRLPKLPEWDREMYPYAVIIYDAFLYAGEYMLFVSDAVVNVINALGGDSPYTDGSCLCYRIENSEFVHYSQLDNTLITGSEIVWANHNIYRGPQDEEPGKLVLSASEPIPVYE